MDAKTDAATIAEQATTVAGEPAKTDLPAGTTASPGQDTGATPDSFAEEDAALNALIAEQARLDAEAVGKTTEAPKKDDLPASTTDVATDTPATPGKASTDAATGAIIALRKQNQELKGALLIAEGEKRVLRSLVDPNKAPESEGETPPEPTVEEVRADIFARRKALFQEVDAGKKSMGEVADALAEFDLELAAVARAEAEAIAQSAVVPAGDLGLDEWTNKTLIPEYPVLAKLSKAQLDPLNALAYQQAALEGKPIQAGPLGTKELRQRIADLAEQFYDKPAYQAREAKRAATATSEQPPVKPGADNVTALPTAEQRAAKLKLATEMPLEIGKTGAGAQAGELTDEQVEAALSGNEDQRLAFMASHPALIQKVMGPGYRAR